ncbi:unnamed protein product [Paramecium octaurelia]|uniref:WD40-repeat-containing domain n=1 Tax=Paramecium octaurelia TaxID=43137 RepID=A0A8S1XNK0_PAROT|nr:unnamed protein product [Paramecium octaurelia]
MSDLEKREYAVNIFEATLNQLISKFEDSQPQSQHPQQEFNYSLYGSTEIPQQENFLNSTTDLLTGYIMSLQELKKCFDKNKSLLLNVPSGGKELQQHLSSIIQLQKSSIFISYTDISKQKLNDFINYYPQQIAKLCPKHNQKTELIDISNDLNIVDRRVCYQCDNTKIRLSVLLNEYLMKFFQFKNTSEQKRAEIKANIQILIDKIGIQQNIENFYIDLEQRFKKRIDIIDKILNAAKMDDDFLDLSDIAKDFINTQDNFQKFEEKFITNVNENMRQDLIIAKDHLENQIKKLSGEQLSLIQSSKIQKETIYKSISEESQTQKCQALCFNYNDNLIATAKHNVIIIWDFVGGKMNFSTELKGHNGEISCLLFDKDSNSLISGGGDADCIINLWVCTEYQKWKLQKTYQQEGGIKVMLFNKQGDQLIIGSQKGQIKIFKTDSLELIKEYKDDQNKQPIFGLSLNDDQNYLVQCGMDESLRLYQFGQELKLIFKQKCKGFGMRIKFIDNSSFVFIQKDGNLIYCKIEWNKVIEIQQFRLSSEKEDVSYTPIWYDSISKLLIVKYNKSIFFLKLVDGRFQKIDQLESKYYQLFATVSNSGKYLITWIGKGKQQYQGERHDLYQIYELNYQ